MPQIVCLHTVVVLEYERESLAGSACALFTRLALSMMHRGLTPKKRYSTPSKMELSKHKFLPFSVKMVRSTASAYAGSARTST